MAIAPNTPMSVLLSLAENTSAPIETRKEAVEDLTLRLHTLPADAIAAFARRIAIVKAEIGVADENVRVLQLEKDIRDLRAALAILLSNGVGKAETPVSSQTDIPVTGTAVVGSVVPPQMTADSPAAPVDSGALRASVTTTRR